MFFLAFEIKKSVQLKEKVEQITLKLSSHFEYLKNSYTVLMLFCNQSKDTFVYVCEWTLSKGSFDLIARHH